MAESCESTLQADALLPSLASRPQKLYLRRWESAPTNLPAKRTLAACGFLLAYTAVYIGAGFAAIALVEYAWAAIFG
jgi:hypothetical protein